MCAIIIVFAAIAADFDCECKYFVGFINIATVKQQQYKETAWILLPVLARYIYKTGIQILFGAIVEYKKIWIQIKNRL